ncbi:TonB-dependent receptor domain-containing protein [Steroidobacter flavus]|uniref:TonB-dependent receptor domain-containing protein n=1 Tax=Steroidobacter flavus TaxID=1842136 RepID=A0ABV8SXW6_9GAMM
MLKTKTFRSTLLAAACSVALCAPVMADTARKVDIPAGELTSALQRLAEQSGAEFMYSADRLKGVHTNGAQGEYTAEQAVMKLLEGTKFKLLVGERGALLISDNPGPTQQRISLTSGGRLHLAQAAESIGNTPNLRGSDAPGTGSTGLEEIVVTATKRKERLRDLAGAASATTGVQLAAIGAQSNADYLGRLPGVVFNEGTSGQSTVTIRGIGTTAGVDQGQGPTGYFINEVPLSEPSYASGIPDIDTFDLDRVEVLRGPQGTLFGSSSLGGAVNYIVKTANPAQFDAATETTLRSIDHSGGDVSYTAKAMFNLPLIADKLAVRIVGSTRYDAGYVDNVGTGVDGSNDTEVKGVRASIVFTPSEMTTLSLLSLYQENQLDDFQTVQSTYGRYHRSTRFSVPSEYTMELHSLRLDQDVSFANLTVLASTHDKDHVLDSDVSLSNAVRNFVPNGVLSREDFTTTMRTIEARLSSKDDGGALKWVFGAMYSDTESKVATLSIAPGGNAALAARYNPALLQGDLFNLGYSFRNGYEKALFGEASLTFARDWTLTLGGRLFDTRYALRLERYGIQAPTGPVFIPEREALGDGFVPKISVAYRPNSDHTIYALASKGFRFGNPNTVADLPGFDTPTSWDSDELWNYELGSHSVLMGGLLQVDASLFYIDWKDIQVRLVRPDNLTYGTNAGTARSRGVELAAAFRPIDPLTFTTNVTYLDAELTETVTIASPPLLDGTQLPGASEWQISNTLTYNFDTVLSPSVILSHRYLSDAPETLQQPYVRVAGYNQFDVRTNFDLGRFDLGLFVTNLTDRRAVTFGYGISATGTGRNEFITRPRTFGITLNWNFNQ